MAKRSGDEFVIKKSSLRTISVVMLTLLVGVYLGSQFFSPKSATTTTTIQQRVQVSVDDDPFLGSSDAPLTVIEFSDFQCPFCRSAYQSILPQLKKDYVETGKIKFVYRDFPLSFHPMSEKSAEAADCANDQGKFWEMHNKIFDEQAKLGTGTIQYNVTDINNWASGIGLDAAKFDLCLDSGKYVQEVRKDASDGGRAGVQGTPTFFIGNSKNGYVIIPGAVPYATFKQAVDQELAR